MARTTVSLDDELEQALTTASEVAGISKLDAVRKAIRLWVESVDAGGEASRPVQAIASATRSFTNPYQQLVAAWRLERVQDQVGGISSYRFDLDAWPADIYLMTVLSELMRKLDSHDEFLAITIVPFWSDPTLGVGGNSDKGREHFYLKAQEQAIAKGMRLYRVFLLEGGEDEPDVLRLHARFLERVSQASPGGARVGVVPPAPDKNLLLRFGHFACIRRVTAGSEAGAGDDDGCLIVEPVYDATKEIRRLRLLFSRGGGDDDAATRFYLDRFRHAASSAEPLEDYLGRASAAAGTD